MDRLKGLPLGRQLILGAGVLLIIDTFLNWQSRDIGSLTFTRSGFHGFLGIVMWLLTVALVLWVAARAFEVALPDNVPDGLTTLALGVLIFLFALIKNLSDDYSAFWAYVGVVLAAIIAYGSWLVFSASGEALPSMGSTGSSNTTTSVPPPAAPPTTEE
jgi:hypothetical protein